MNLDNLNISDDKKAELERRMQVNMTALANCAICGRVLEVRNTRITNFCGTCQPQARYANKRYTNWNKGTLDEQAREKLKREGSR